MAQQRLELGQAQKKLRDFVASEKLVRNPLREKAYGIGAQPRALRSAVKYQPTVERMGGVGESANAVDWAKVNAIDYRKKFDAISSDPELNALIHGEALRMLKHRNNTDFEDLSVINRSRESLVGRSTKATIPGETRYTEVLKKQIEQAKRNGDALIVVHNHPNGLGPSLGDILSAKARGYSKSVIVGHDGSLFVIDRVDDAFRVYHHRELYNSFLVGGKTELEAAILTLDKLRSMGLLSWRSL
jgi:hypothetical protein